MMSLKSIGNINLFATLATEYIGIMSSEKEATINLYFTQRYAIERVLTKTRSGIKGFLMKKAISTANLGGVF